MSCSINQTHRHVNKSLRQWCAFWFCFCAILYVMYSIEHYLEGDNEPKYINFFQRPFPINLDPFLYRPLKTGYTVEDPIQLNPIYHYNYEETVLTKFIDYYFETNKLEVQFNDESVTKRVYQTIWYMGNHLRNILLYKSEHYNINPQALLTTNAQRNFLLYPSRTLTKTTGSNFPSNSNVYKLIWTSISHCSNSSEVLEEALHELGNRHHFLFLRGRNRYFKILTRGDEQMVAEVITHVPFKLVYVHEHSFIDFSKYKKKIPIYVAIVCNPIERKLRQFFQDRHEMKEYSGTRNLGIPNNYWWNQTLEECLASDSFECGYKKFSLDVNAVGPDWRPRRSDAIIPSFCREKTCNILGSLANLKSAQDVAKNSYTVVGTWENLEETLALLEAKIPTFFRGITKIYHDKLAAVKEIARTPTNLHDINPKSRSQLQENFKSEMEFYESSRSNLLQEYTSILSAKAPGVNKYQSGLS